MWPGPGCGKKATGRQAMGRGAGCVYDIIYILIKIYI